MKIENIKKTSFNDNDIIMLKFDGWYGSITDEDINRLKNRLKEFFNLKRVLILSDGLDIQVISKEATVTEIAEAIITLPFFIIKGESKWN
jgi:hypothetical protein